MFNLRNKKAFTIIELIVVIAVLGILVLLGMPKLIGYTAKAQLVRIQHDTKVMQDKMEETMSDTTHNFYEWDGNQKDLGKLVLAKQLYETEGLAKKVDKSHIKYPKYNWAGGQGGELYPIEELGIGGDLITESVDGFGYKIIPDEYKGKIKTRLKGTFYSNAQGKVYYEPNKPIKGANVEAAPNCVAADTIDYVFEAATGTITKYTGTAQYIVIPHSFLVDGKCIPVRVIGRGAFQRGTFPRDYPILEVILPDGLTKIEEDAFKDNGLTEVIIPSGVTEVASGAFVGNNILPGGLIVKGPAGSGGIHANAFNPGVTPVYQTVTDKDLGVSLKPMIDKGGQVIKSPSGRPTASITSGNSASPSTGRVVIIPGVIKVDNTEVEIVEVDKGAFQGEGIIHVTFPTGLEVIEDYAFAGNQLIGVELPSNVNYVGNYAFGYNEVYNGKEHIWTIGNINFQGDNYYDSVNKQSGNIVDNAGKKVDRLKGSALMLDHVWLTSNSKVQIDNIIKPVDPIGPGEPSIPSRPEPGSKVKYTKEEVDALVNEGYIKISTAEELSDVRYKTSSKFIQVTDIDLAGVSSFSPIGNEYSNFTGVYDGGGFTISNLKINSTSTSYIGLFSYTSNAIIKNVGLERVDIKGRSFTSGLIGRAESSEISNSYVTGAIVSSSSTVGGLVGIAFDNSKISDSYATGSVKGNYSGIGGLVGTLYNSTIDNSYSISSVSGHLNTGGLVGQIDSSKILNSHSGGYVGSTSNETGGLVGISNNSEIDKTYSTASIHGANYRGGLIGKSEKTTVKNSYATGKVNGNGNVAGGLIGTHFSGEIINSYATGLVINSSTVSGGLIASNYASEVIKNSYWDKQTTGRTTSNNLDSIYGLTTEQMKTQSSYSGWDFDTIWKMNPGEYPTLR